MRKGCVHVIVVPPAGIRKFHGDLGLGCEVVSDGTWNVFDAQGCSVMHERGGATTLALDAGVWLHDIGWGCPIDNIRGAAREIPGAVR
jgi:hypothetical protein